MTRHRPDVARPGGSHYDEGVANRTRWRRPAAALVSAGALVAVCAALLTAPLACTRPNPSYCDAQHACASGVCDMAKHQCVSSTGSCDPTRCPPNTPVCDLSSGACVACKPGAAGDAQCAARDPSTPICATGGRCVACKDSSQCPKSTPICAAGACMQCTSTSDGDKACAARSASAPYCAGDGTCVTCKDSAQCPKSAPVCDSSSHTCRGCQSDGECSTGVCDVGGGTCVTAGRIVYVDGDNGSDGSQCGTPAAPCQTIAQMGGALEKVTSTRSYVHLAATSAPYKENVHIDGMMLMKVTFVGPGATIDYPGYPIDSPFVDITGGATVTFDGVTLTGASGQKGDDITCTGPGTSLHLRGVTIEQSALSGVNASHCSLAVDDSDIKGNGGDGLFLDTCDATITGAHVTGNSSIGIEASAGSVSLERSLIQGNHSGGVSMLNTGFEIVNDVIEQDGDPQSSFGGVRINNSGVAMQTLAFNTVTENHADPDRPAFGVECSTTNPTLTADSNIVWGGGGPSAAVSGDCMWKYSDVQNGGLGGSNIDNDPKLDSSDHYHLTAGSPCVDKGDPKATVSEDYDGDPRPQGSAPDIGADER